MSPGRGYAGETPALKTIPHFPAGPQPGKPRLVRPAGKYVLRLFVAGATTRSRAAVLRVKELCAAERSGGCRLEVIDIYQQPELARANQIVATPTLIKEFPRPVRRFIGNLLHTAGLFGAPALVDQAGLV